MSDLLSRMIGRAAEGGFTPLVEPVLSSRYEAPVPPGSGHPFAESEAPAPRSAMTEVGDEERRIAGVESLESPSSKPSPSPLRPVGQTAERGREAAAAPVAQVVAPSGFKQEFEDSPRQWDGSPDAREPADFEIRVYKTEVSNGVGVAQRSKETRDAAAEPRVVEPTLAMVREASGDRLIAASAGAAAPQPVEVQVTIGHIEVRSAAAPATPQRIERRAARPAVTLDDYLRRRNGGSR